MASTLFNAFPSLFRFGPTRARPRPVQARARTAPSIPGGRPAGPSPTAPSIAPAPRKNRLGKARLSRCHEKTPQNAITYDAISDSTALSPEPKPCRREPKGRLERFSLDFQSIPAKGPNCEGVNAFEPLSPSFASRPNRPPLPCAPPRRPAPAPRPPLRPAIRRAKGPGQAESARLRRVRFGFGAGGVGERNRTEGHTPHSRDSASTGSNRAALLAGQ